jgi:hypothetical protein
MCECQIHYTDHPYQEGWATEIHFDQCAECAELEEKEQSQLCPECAEPFCRCGYFCRLCGGDSGLFEVEDGLTVCSECYQMAAEGRLAS